MGEKLKQTEQLLNLFDKREKAKASYNQQIALLIAPTVLAAIIELLAVDVDAIDWKDISATDAILLLRCTVLYDPTGEVSPFLQKVGMDPLPTQQAKLVQKDIQFALPLEMAFSTPKEIIDFFLLLIADEVIPTPVVPANQPKELFDMKTLTKEQIQLLLFAQQNIPGTIQ